MTETNKPENHSRRDVTFHIKLTLEAPILTRATEAAPGLSNAAARDHRGRFYLAGSLIKGCLRESLEEIYQGIGINQLEIDQWLGAASADSSNNAPNRGRLHFSDFITTETADSQVAIRIRMDSTRGAVDQGALAFLELPFAPGRKIIFSGTIRTAVTDHKEQQWLQKIISSGLRWIPALGGQQGIGFGRLLLLDITARPCRLPVPASMPAPTPCPGSLYLSLVPDAPFCLARHTPLTNRFEADEIISGAVLKGVIAHTLNRITGRNINHQVDAGLPDSWRALGRNFSRLRFTHAFPVQTVDGPPASPAARPVQPPLTTVVAADNIYDIALRPRPGLINGKAPAFTADWKWKDYQAVRQRFGWPSDLVTKLRVRTAIDIDHRRAKDSELFAMELLVPDEHEWLCRVDFTDVPTNDRSMVVNQLKTLLNYGLVGLGKTKVSVTVKISNAPVPGRKSLIEPLAIQYNGKVLPVWIVTLQTETLMINPKKIAGPELCTAENLQKQYEEYWAGVSPGVQLHTFYAAQSLRGRYLTHRFQADKPYNPYLLTQAGSVFLLTAQEDDIREAGNILAALQEDGLPLPANWPAELYGQSAGTKPTWQECPWLPENGFGEIKVNLSCHTVSCPGWEDIP